MGATMGCAGDRGLWPGPAGQAQGYPAKTVTIVVPAAAGGGIDITARQIGAELANALGKSFVVENKGGGSGNLGAAQVARATPDGYTLLFTLSGLSCHQSRAVRQSAIRSGKSFSPVA